MHPINNTNVFKSFVFKSTMLNIFIGFILLYILMAIVLKFFDLQTFLFLRKNVIMLKLIISLQLAFAIV